MNFSFTEVSQVIMIAAIASALLSSGICLAMPKAK